MIVLTTEYLCSFDLSEIFTYENQSTESTDGDGCIEACKSSNREIFSLIPFVQPSI